MQTMRCSFSAGLVALLAACSAGSPSQQGEVAPDPGPVAALPSAQHGLAYFEGFADPKAGTMSLTFRAPSGEVTSQTTLPWGTSAGDVYLHTCPGTTYSAGTHQLTGSVQGVNLMSGSVLGYNAVVDSISQTGVTLASGTNSGASKGIVASYGVVAPNTADCASTQPWAFQNVAGDPSFTFVGHVEGIVPPVSSGLVAYFDASVLSSITQDGSNNVSQWRDISGNGVTLTPNGGSPVYNASLINSMPGLNFSGDKGMISGSFALNTSVTLFFVIQWGAPRAWGSVAHHGDRDQDWAMEQNGLTSTASPTITHWQSCNDNGGEQITLTTGTNYLLNGVITASPASRSYTAISTADGTVTGAPANSCNSISPGSKQMYVGRSNNGTIESFNGYYGALVYYNRALSGAEISSMTTFLRAQWGI